MLPVAASDSSCLVLLRLSPSRGPQGSFVGTCFATLPHDKGIIQCSLLLQLVQNGVRIELLSPTTAVAVEWATAYAHQMHPAFA